MENNIEDFLRLSTDEGGNHLLKESMITDFHIMDKFNELVGACDYGDEMGLDNAKEQFKKLMLRLEEETKEFKLERAKIENNYFTQIIGSAEEKELFDKLYNDLYGVVNPLHIKDKEDLLASFDFFTSRTSFFLINLIGGSLENKEKVIDIYAQVASERFCDLQREEIENILMQYINKFEMSQIATKTPDNAYMGVDMVNEKLFNSNSVVKSGEVLDIPTTPQRKNKHIISVSLFFDMPESFRLTAKQRRIINAIGTIYLSWEDKNKPCICTLNQIMDIMGYKGTPNKKQRDSVINDMRKLSTIRLIFEDEYGNTGLLIDQTMLNYTMAVLTNKGKFVESAIKINELPPSIRYSSEIRHITSFKKFVAEMPTGLSMTENNIQIQDFLIKQIARLTRNPHCKTVTRNITYESVKEHCNVTLRKSKLEETIICMMDKFKSEGFIKDYEVCQKGIYIHELSKKEREKFFLVCEFE